MNLKNITSLLFMSLVIILLFLACEDNSKEEVLPLIPLEEGNYWVMEELTYADFGDTMIVTDVETIRIEIHGDTTINGIEAHRYIQSDLPEYVFFFSNRDDGVYEEARRFDNGDTTIFSQSGMMIWKHPADVGDVFDGYNTNIEITATDTIHSTPLGDFECLIYESFSTPFDRHYFFCPGTGHVGTITYNYTTFEKEKKLIDMFVAQ